MAELRELFDANWYLSQYADVATAGVDPLQHYLTHGRFEGRQPCALAALQLDTALWQAKHSESYLIRLQNMVDEAQPLHAALAAWVLARWHGSFARWQQVLPLAAIWLNDELALDVIGHQGPFLLAFSAYINTGDRVKAKALPADIRWTDSADKTLAITMLLSGKDKIATLNRLFTRNGLAELSCANEEPQLDTLHSSAVTNWWQRWRQPLVSVIVPCYNAAATLPCALNSLLAQSWANLEVLVADDASTDSSVAVVQAYAAKDKRVKLLQLKQNSGAYAARNLAMQQAKGHFITTHDADDWSHPEKIARQVLALQQNSVAMASVSHWVRCDANLQFQRWRAEDSWIHRNVSSLLFRRRVQRTLGYWDLVSVNADTEYYYRIKQAFGEQSIVEVMPGMPLAFGRVEAESLSQHSATHVRTQYQGVRKQYMDAAFNWHRCAAAAGLYLPAEPQCRPFAAPPPLCRGPDSLRLHNKKLLIEAANGFAANWYLNRYPDVAAAGVDALEHYLLHGEAEGRDPMPLFSSSGYAYKVSLAAGESALLAAVTVAGDALQPVLLAGGQPDPGGAHVMLFSHAADSGQFGAERSFVDVLKALQGAGYRLTVVLPCARNVEYVSRVRQCCQSLLILPYAWWFENRPCQGQQVDYLSGFMTQQQVRLVYVNTLVLYEPLLAARAADVPSVVHVRELPQHDAGLCEALQASAEQVRQHVLTTADHLIANSEVVAGWLAVPKRCTVIANAIDLDAVAEMTAGDKLRVAMLSSNLAKKGLADFIVLAQSCAQQQLPMEFYLFGPDSPDLQHYIIRDELPDNVRLCGYIASPELALAQVDVVVNLSHFQESFGRTVLEAMQAARVVVAYDWGALPGLIQPGCGFLVPFKDVMAVQQILLRLHQDRVLLHTTAQQAKAYARQQFSLVKLGQSLRTLFNRIMA